MKRTFSKPVLQNHAETTIDVVWSVCALSTGFVEISEREDLSGARKIPAIKGDHACQWGVGDCALHVHVDGLRPATRYWYRAATLAVDYPGAYMIQTDPPIYGDVHSFVTAGAAAKSEFAVVNDTHERLATVRRIAGILEADPTPVLVWNGDAFEPRTLRHAADAMLASTAGALSDTPLLYTIGNHETRGIDAWRLDEVMVKRPFAERCSQFWMLGRNFAVRQGDIAILGLDTGEDKADRRPEWAGLANFEPYRRLQADWLEEALARPEIASAPFKVAICHIPLADDDPRHNPGGTERGDDRYSADFAYWERSCGELWSPTFVRHGVQLVVAGHMHRFRYDAPRAGRPWAQIVGGGTGLGSDSATDSLHDVATIIRVLVVDDRLVAEVRRLDNGESLGRYAFERAR